MVISRLTVAVSLDCIFIVENLVLINHFTVQHMMSLGHSRKHLYLPRGIRSYSKHPTPFDWMS
jgi:hypothetical protein